MLTTTEAAERLGISKRSVARLIKRGRIAAEKRGRDYLIEEAEVERAQTRPGRGRPRKGQDNG
jgi:excisionase family DNA binding protein